MSELKMPENAFGYEHNGSSVIWNVEDIWRAADSLKITTLDIDYFHGMMANVQLEYDEDDWRRVEEADLKYPIIVGRCKKKDGYLLIDGFHRLEKHHRLKHTKIPAKVIQKMPAPFSVKGKPFEIDGLNFEWKMRAASLESFRWMNW